MKKEKVLGILGGMGPEATVYFMRKVIELTPAERDQDHLIMIVMNDPKVPDRTEAILHGGESPLPRLRRDAQLLEEVGADLIAVPCNTFFYFYDEMRRSVNVPIIHMIEETAKALESTSIDVAGLLATTATVRTGLYHSSLERRGIDVIVPEDVDGVMRAIKEVKAGIKKGPRQSLLREARRLLVRGADVVVAGCTEVPLVIAKEDVPLVDPMEIMAKRAIQELKGLEIATA